MVMFTDGVTTADGNPNTVEFDAGDICMEELGRIVQLDFTLRSVCPRKRVALAVLLHEVDANGFEHKCGMKMMTVPSHTSESCRDVTVRCITFVLPEDLDVSDNTGTICNQRNFRARFIAHYIDHNYDRCCCEDIEG